jgi:uncharacterized protein (DUF924 family)
MNTSGDSVVTPIEARDVLDFWIAAGAEKWFTKDAAFDAAIAAGFGAHLEAAKAGAYDGWSTTTHGSLALVIMLDQFSRNLHRGSTRAFEGDPKALALAKRMVAARADMELPAPLRKWAYLPFEHSEDMADQKTCVSLMERTGERDDLPWAIIHHDIIAQFGRFPHRNAVLGRVSTHEELRFLQDGGFGG